MYSISPTSFGLRVTFSGHLTRDEARRWVAESEQVLSRMQRGFRVLVDMRELRPTTDEAYAEFAAGQGVYELAGMDRSAVVLSSPELVERFGRLARESGDDEWERFIDASTRPDWEKVALDWLEGNVSPDSQDVPA